MIVSHCFFFLLQLIVTSILFGIAVQPTQQKCTDENQVCLNIEAGVPVIDVTPLLSNSTEEAKRAVRSSIGAACRGWGMFYITNHGTEVIAKDFIEQVKLFFDSSKELKNSVRRQANNSRGFADDEFTKQKIDTKEIFDVGHKPFPDLEDDAIENMMLDGYNQWPVGTGLENFQNIVENYYIACSELAAVLLSAIASDLGIDPQIFEDAFSNHTSFLRLNYYPVFNRKESSSDFLGVNRHTDAGVLTLLMQDTNSALEVYSGTKQDNNDGTWIHVDPVPGGLAINVCDMLQVWSNNEYKAPEHRVRASLENKRYSSPFFYNPNYNVNIEPFVTERSSRKHAQYNPINYGHFRQRRFQGDFADTGKEIQIEDYLKVTI